MIHELLLVFAFVLAVIRSFNIGVPRVDLGWLAFAIFVGSLFFNVRP